MLTQFSRRQIEIRIAQSTFEVVNVEDVIWLTVFAHIKEEFIVAICKVETFIVVTSDYGGKEGEHNENLNNFLDHVLVLIFSLSLFTTSSACGKIYFKYCKVAEFFAQTTRVDSNNKHTS